MNPGLEQVKAAMAAALEQASIRALAAFSPGWAKSYREPVVAVGLRTGESRRSALGSYLGIQTDATGHCQEIYGLELELTLSLDIYTPPDTGEAGGEAVLDKLHQVLLQGLPSGLKPHELRWEETLWDTDTGMFLRRGSLRCAAYFTAAVSEEGLLLRDFILKGTVTK